MLRYVTFFFLEASWTCQCNLLESFLSCFTLLEGLCFFSNSGVKDFLNYLSTIFLWKKIVIIILNYFQPIKKKKYWIISTYEMYICGWSHNPMNVLYVYIPIIFLISVSCPSILLVIWDFCFCGGLYKTSKQ